MFVGLSAARLLTICCAFRMSKTLAQDGALSWSCCYSFHELKLLQFRDSIDFSLCVLSSIVVCFWLCFMRYASMETMIFTWITARLTQIWVRTCHCLYTLLFFSIVRSMYVLHVHYDYSHSFLCLIEDLQNNNHHYRTNFQEHAVLYGVYVHRGWSIKICKKSTISST